MLHDSAEMLREVKPKVLLDLHEAQRDNKTVKRFC